MNKIIWVRLALVFLHLDNKIAQILAVSTGNLSNLEQIKSFFWLAN